jgi:hypothetical protein
VARVCGAVTEIMVGLKIALFGTSATTRVHRAKIITSCCGGPWGINLMSYGLIVVLLAGFAGYHAFRRRPLTKFGVSTIAKSCAVLDEFFAVVEEHNKEHAVLRLILRKPRRLYNAQADGLKDIRGIEGRYVQLRGGIHVQMNYKYAWREEVKNIELEELVPVVSSFVKQNLFKEVVCETSEVGYNLASKLRPGQSEPVYVLRRSPIAASSITRPELSRRHDRHKESLISIDEPFLQLLGVTTAPGSTATSSIADSNDHERMKRPVQAARPKVGMKDKLRQIERFVEIVDGLVSQRFGDYTEHVRHNATRVTGTIDTTNHTELRVVDMGSGLGYLTFAVHMHLRRRFPRLRTTGVERRADLVQRTSAVARQLGEGYDGLSFVKSSLEDYIKGETAACANSAMLSRPLRATGAGAGSPGGTPTVTEGAAASYSGSVDVLLALHACDTATDDAIAYGIHSNASIIVVAPCCHKEVRRQFREQSWKVGWEGVHTSVTDADSSSGDARLGYSKSSPAGDGAVNPAGHSLAECLRHGTYEERTAEMVTDTLRALFLQYAGYGTKVFEFVSGEHTAKNVLITAVKRVNSAGRGINRQHILSRIQQLKGVFGIGTLHLEMLLGLSK